MEDKVDKNSLIATVDAANSETILGYSSNYKFYDLRSNRYFTYVIWDKKRYNTKINYDYFDNEILSGRDTYFILSYKNNVCDFSYYVLEQIENKYKTELVFSAFSKETIVKDEKYELYKASLK